MKRTFTTSTLVLLVLALASGCGSGTDLSRSDTQSSFGVKMAKMNLWREAMFRFKRAVEMRPDDPMAHNNLAVAYEANGDFEKAADEYRIAMRLDRSNQYIQKNYSRLVEFTSRNKKRQAAPGAATTPAATTPAGTAPAGTPAAPPATPPTTGVKAGEPPSSQPTGTAPASTPQPTPTPKPQEGGQ